MWLFIRDRYWVRFVGLAIAFPLFFWASSLNLVAQESLQWSPQNLIPGYDPLTNTPYLLVDQNRTVHAFNSTWMENQQVIVYSQWTLEQGWTDPIDIILPQLKNQIRLKGAILDKGGLVHLLYFSGDDQVANIYYSSAPLARAGDAHAWSPPLIVGHQARTPDEAAIVMNSKKQLFIIYSSNLEGTGLYFSYSNDQGATWSEPAPIFLTYNNELFPFFLQMYLDEQDGVHALWNVNNRRGMSESFYYTKLEAGQLDWNEPIQFEAGGLNEHAIVEYENELILIFHDNGEYGLTRYMQRSQDGGRTWTKKVQLFPHVGTNGPVSFVTDSNNVLHMFFGNRVTDEDGKILHGLWHSVWNGDRWSDPLAIVSGPAIIDDIGGDGFDPSFANAVVSQGDVILVTWSTDPNAGFNGIWYSYATVDAPELPVIPLITPTRRPDSTINTRITPSILNPEPAPELEIPGPVSDMSGQPSITGPAKSLIYSIGSVSLLIIAAIVVFLSRKN